MVRLAREPGKRETRYMHLFRVEVKYLPAVTDMSNAADGDLQARVAALEIEVAELKQRLDWLLAHLGDSSEKITYRRSGVRRHRANSVVTGAVGSV